MANATQKLMSGRCIFLIHNFCDHFIGQMYRSRVFRLYDWELHFSAGHNSIINILRNRIRSDRKRGKDDMDRSPVWRCDAPVEDDDAVLEMACECHAGIIVVPAERRKGHGNNLCNTAAQESRTPAFPLWASVCFRVPVPRTAPRSVHGAGVSVLFSILSQRLTSRPGSSTATAFGIQTG